MTPEQLQMEPGSDNMTPQRVPEASGTSPGVADGTRGADAVSPGKVKGPSRSAFGTLPGVSPRSISCYPRCSRVLTCSSHPKRSNKQAFFTQYHFAKVLDHMCFFEWERHPPCSLSRHSPLFLLSGNRPEMAPEFILK